MDPRAPEPEPNPAEDFVHIEDPNPVVESLSESFVGVDVPREEAGDEADHRSGGGGGGGGGGGDGGGSDRRRTLPEELSRSVVVLDCESSAEGGKCDVYVVGTAHVSEVSVVKFRALNFGFGMNSDDFSGEDIEGKSK